MATQIRDLPEIFYDPEKATYWRYIIKAARYLKGSASDVKDFLKKRKMEGVDEHNKWALSLGDEILCNVRDEKFVDYAAPLAGHKVGYFETSAGVRVLVTHGICLPSPNYKTKCANLLKYLEALFADQIDVQLLWLKCRYETLARDDFKPGQLSALIGTSGCGKGFYHKLVTELVGGRMANPFRYISGGTTFNADLAQAEHLMMEDPTASSDIRLRRKITNEIKQMVANSESSVHGKNKTAISMPTSHALTFSVNNEFENLMTLPLMDKSMMDKVHLFKVEAAQNTLDEDRQENLKMLMRELPGLVAMLLEMKIPRGHQCPRYGMCCGHTDKKGNHFCKGWHHPEILSVLTDMSEHEQLHSIIQEAFFERDGAYELWSGSTEALKQELSRLGHAHKIEKILFHTSMVGVYLSRLAEKFPAQYTSSASNGKTRWMILPPTEKE